MRTVSVSLRNCSRKKKKKKEGERERKKKAWPLRGRKVLIYSTRSRGFPAGRVTSGPEEIQRQRTRLLYSRLVEHQEFSAGHGANTCDTCHAILNFNPPTAWIQMRPGKKQPSYFRDPNLALFTADSNATFIPVNFAAFRKSSQLRRWISTIIEEEEGKGGRDRRLISRDLNPRVF